MEKKETKSTSINKLLILLICVRCKKITRDLLSKKTKILCLNMTEQVAKPALAHLKLLQEIQKKFLDEQL